MTWEKSYLVDVASDEEECPGIEQTLQVTVCVGPPVRSFTRPTTAENDPGRLQGRPTGKI